MANERQICNRCCCAIDLFTDSDTILITSLFTMHCGLSSVYKYLLSGKKTCKQGGKKYTLSCLSLLFW